MNYKIRLTFMFAMIFSFVACSDDDLTSSDIYYYPDVDPVVGDRTFNETSSSASVSFFIFVDQDETATYEVNVADSELVSLIASEGETLSNNVITGPTIDDDGLVTVRFDPISVGVTSISLTATDSRNNQSVAIIPIIIE